MARYKDYNYDQAKLLPVSFSRQILPGSFEYSLSHLIDHELDLSVFAARYHNDKVGAPAYDPAILLKIILYAYSRGITSSREIERLCRENIVFMALAADSRPHFTTIADFIASLAEQITPLFLAVLLICDKMGLIGRDMFAIDGVKLPSNASKEWSGTKQELEEKTEKMERAIGHMLAKHRQEDAAGASSAHRQKEEQQIETLRRHAKKIKDWLKKHDDKPGQSGPKKSNISDNDSAKMKTGHGVIQGYDGVAAVDAKHQVVVHAQAFGEGQENALLQPMLEATRENFKATSEEENVLAEAKVSADSGFHSEANIQAVFTQKIDGYIADTQFRKRDPRFAGAERHRARVKAERQEQAQREGKQRRYRPSDFIYDEVSQTLICPQGKKLYRNGSHCTFGGFVAIKFQGAQRDCLPCPKRAECLRHPERTPTRQVAIFKGRAAGAQETYTEKMKKKIDTPEGRAQYSRRLGIVEPVFAHIRSALGLNRFSLRGKIKVNIQWKLYCIVHNLTKIHRFGFEGG
jgi:transposase